MNKAILAVSIIIAAAVILFVYSQLKDVDDLVGSVVPFLSDPLQTTTPDGRRGLSNDAFQIGQVGIVNPSDTELSLPDLFQKVERSVVQIADSSEIDVFESRLGSGFVYDDNGHIITNNHVVSGGGNRLDVTFPDGIVYRASLIGSDPSADIAVLYVEEVPKEKLFPLSLADSSKVQVGERVAAVGNPFGLSGSLTSGIVSGVGRQIPAQEEEGFTIPNIIQTDAPINPGNSGGPLLNIRGEVIGINSAIFSATGQFAGVGFAIPSNTIAKVVPSLITTGSYQHPWLGVAGRDMTPGVADRLGLDEPRGFLVMDVVAGSPAEKAGIQRGNEDTVIDGIPMKLGGDVIIAVDNNTVRKIDDILAYVEMEKSVGDDLKLTILREAHTMEVIATLAVRPSQQESP
ncbi:MAG: trypsin-like peptidase domain-containing protein [Thermoproteota archaeon]|nr:trypsin-like peptidase domain-containing protein [Thermoproteota archaeon]